MGTAVMLSLVSIRDGNVMVWHNFIGMLTFGGGNAWWIMTALFAVLVAIAALGSIVYGIFLFLDKNTLELLKHERYLMCVAGGLAVVTAIFATVAAFTTEEAVVGWGAIILPIIGAAAIAQTFFLKPKTGVSRWVGQRSQTEPRQEAKPEPKPELVPVAEDTGEKNPFY